jgi:hypothetical protein
MERYGGELLSLKLYQWQPPFMLVVDGCRDQDVPFFAPCYRAQPEKVARYGPGFV